MTLLTPRWSRNFLSSGERCNSRLYPCQVLFAERCLVSSGYSVIFSLLLEFVVFLRTKTDCWGDNNCLLIKSFCERLVDNSHLERLFWLALIFSRSMPKLRDGFSFCAARSETARRQVIRPFVCSTFKDFHAERNFLQEKTFPQLNKICNERGTSFIPVDLRWNKSQSQQNSEHVLRLCLDSNGRCAPFFISSCWEIDMVFIGLRSLKWRILLQKNSWTRTVRRLLLKDTNGYLRKTTGTDLMSYSPIESSYISL